MIRALRRLCLFLALPVLLSAAARAESPLQVAVNAGDVPFAMVDERGEITGFNADIARALCRAMRADCKLVPLTFAQAMDQVAAGQIDFAVANALRTPEREKRLLFSEPYWRSSSSLLGRAAGNAGRDALEAMMGHRVAAAQGSRQLAFLEAQQGANLTILTAANSEEAFAWLREGKAELVLAPTTSGLNFLKLHGQEGFDFVGMPIKDQGLGGPVHIVFPKGRDEVKTRVDQALTTILRDGSYQAVNRRYFPFSIY